MPFLCAYTSGIQGEKRKFVSIILLNGALYMGKTDVEEKEEQRC
jgi:hypothetical protein